MKKNDIEKAIGRLVPDEGMEQRLLEKITQKQSNRSYIKPIISIAACLLIAVSLGIFGYNLAERKPDTSSQAINSAGGVYIPKVELPKKTNALMDMAGLIVYQGRVYAQALPGTRIDPESAENLLDEKLGTTKDSIDEWSKQDDYAVEFASNIGMEDVYSVKGYDKSFRIMTYAIMDDGTRYAQFYECLNGIAVKTGADIFDKLKIENNIKTAKIEKYDSWNHGKKQYQELASLEALNSFVNELKNTVPYKQESLSYLFDDNGETNQRFIYITLNDGCEVQLRLFRQGYVYYDNSHIFFKIESPAFSELWNELR